MSLIPPKIPADIHHSIRTLITYIGDDPDREGLKETPNRIIKSYAELFRGYQQDPAEVFKVFEDGACDEMVILKDIPMTSFCEHHLLPFSGVAHVGYVPHGKIIGLSKLARLVDIFSARLQVQERLTTQITNCIYDHLSPRGVGCVIEASHSCMSCRGVKKPNAVMVTSCLIGAIKDDARTRSEFLQFIKG